MFAATCRKTCQLVFDILLLDWLLLDGLLLLALGVINSRRSRCIVGENMRAIPGDAVGRRDILQDKGKLAIVLVVDRGKGTMILVEGTVRWIGEIRKG